jgi:hypothetical protein
LFTKLVEEFGMEPVHEHVTTWPRAIHAQ